MAELPQILRSKFACMTPWIAMAVLLAAAAWINWIIQLDALPLGSARLFPADVGAAMSADLAAVTRHLTARITWGLSGIGFSLVSLAAIVTTLYVIRSCFREVAGRDRVAAVWLIGVCAALFALIAAFGADRILSEPAATTALRKATLHRTWLSHAVEADSYFDNVSYLVFVLLAAAASAILLGPTVSKKSAEVLRRRITRLQALLLIGAAALAMRAIEMYLLYRWPGAWLTGPDAHSVDDIALAVSTAYGAFFTGVLASIYLPTAFLLRARAGALADGASVDNQQDRDGWLEKSGLKLVPLKEFAHLLAILAPLLAGGPLASVIGAFGA